jgi:succinate dehydrogenase hydrophobic anchor subunit
MTKTPTTFAELVAFFLDLINQIIPLLMGAVFVYLIWKMIDAWIIHADDTSKVEEGKTIVITGVIVFVIMVSIWGIISLLRRSLF